MIHTHTQAKHSSHSSTAFWGQLSTTFYSFQMSYEQAQMQARNSMVQEEKPIAARTRGISLKLEQMHF